MMISMVKLMRYDRTGRAKTEYARSDTKLCTARTGGQSNGFRLRCRVGALFRQTDASATIRWCLLMISMVKLMRYNCAAARRSFDANSDRTASASLDLRSGRPVTVMVPAEAVSLRIKRLSQPPVMPYNE